MSDGCEKLMLRGVERQSGIRRLLVGRLIKLSFYHHHHHHTLMAPMMIFLNVIFYSCSMVAFLFLKVPYDAHFQICILHSVEQPHLINYPRTPLISRKQHI